MTKLTAKQDLFCHEYMKDLNATQAAIRAGYSVKTAKEGGYENLTKPHIAEKIAELKAQSFKRCEIDADYVLREANRCFKICSKETVNNNGDEAMVDSGNAKGFLEILAKHKKVAAFVENESDKEEKPIQNINITLASNE